MTAVVAAPRRDRLSAARSRLLGFAMSNETKRHEVLMKVAGLSGIITVCDWMTGWSEGYASGSRARGKAVAS